TVLAADIGSTELLPFPAFKTCVDFSGFWLSKCERNTRCSSLVKLSKMEPLLFPISAYRFKSSWREGDFFTTSVPGSVFEVEGLATWAVLVSESKLTKHPIIVLLLII